MNKYQEAIDNMFKLLECVLDKETPKKPNVIFREVMLDIEQLVYDKPMTYCCPNCNQVVNDVYHNYCSKCGQKLDWSDEDGK